MLGPQIPEKFQIAIRSAQMNYIFISIVNAK